MAVNIQYGAGNAVQRPISHTREITPAILTFLGASPENVEFKVNGRVYSGALNDGDTVEVQQKANSKA